jgi:hypothetical protein
VKSNISAIINDEYEENGMIICKEWKIEDCEKKL